MLSWQLFSLVLATLTVVLFSGALLSWGESPPLVSLLLFFSGYSSGRASLCAWAEHTGRDDREEHELPRAPQDAERSSGGGERP